MDAGKEDPDDGTEGHKPQQETQNFQPRLDQGFVLKAGEGKAQKDEGKNPAAKAEAAIEEIREVRADPAQQVGFLSGGD